MTVVAYRNGVMASDSLITTGNGYVEGSIRKILKTDEGYLVGVAGDLAQATKFLDIFEDHSIDVILDDDSDTFEKMDSIEGLVVDPNGKVYVFYNGYFSPVDSQFYACGSGVLAAKGAMRMGANPEQAVEIAKEFVISCGGDIQRIEL